MSSYRPRKDASGGLPNLSYIHRKPKPLGTKFKAAVADAETGVMMHLEIQEGKEAMRKKPLSPELGVCTASTVRFTEAVCAPHEEKRCMLGDSCFGSVKVCLAPTYELCTLECSERISMC